ncbi:diphosphomevalonate decarboxylase isoform X1 [Mustela nigripes]|uniref:diphosphomevalonate decarboxylase isoform X1 n=1 Tax=Mustela nigripes TaxID=77151 RepID=UPI002816363C|nr:diphosphomevalonate decarboxylase isoform X1 [Mustela nigripes]
MAPEKPVVAVTCTAPVNIAVIKYWGKRDEDLVLPINSSLSVTLHQDQLKTTTTAAISKDFTEDRIWLNGREEDVEQPRLQACLREIRRLARKRRSAGDEDPAALGLSYKVHVASVNNFPTAAGLASSAAGYACLAYTLAQVYGVESDLSEVARRGSGSACRSLYGGFVEWQMGERADGKDSIARQVAPESHWPELRVLILVVSAEKKLTGSTAGMRTSVETSPLLRFRAESVVPARMAEMARCVRERDFPGFAQLTMKDSNQFHATCLDTFPPISYLSDTSRRVVHLVHHFNAHHGQTKVSQGAARAARPTLRRAESGAGRGPHPRRRQVHHCHPGGTRASNRGGPSRSPPGPGRPAEAGCLTAFPQGSSSRPWKKTASLGWGCWGWRPGGLCLLGLQAGPRAAAELGQWSDQAVGERSPPPAPAKCLPQCFAEKKAGPSTGIRFWARSRMVCSSWASLQGAAPTAPNGSSAGRDGESAPLL